MFNILEFVGGLGVALLIIIAVTQVIIPEFFGWPKFWIFDSGKRAKIEGAPQRTEPSNPRPNNQTQLTNNNKK